MPVQFPYPTNDWANGTMRKRNGTPPDQPEMTPAQRVYEAFAPDLPESASGKAVATPSDQAFANALARGTLARMITGIAQLPTAVGRAVTGEGTQHDPHDLALAGHIKDWWEKRGRATWEAGYPQTKEAKAE